MRPAIHVVGRIEYDASEVVKIQTVIPCIAQVKWEHKKATRDQHRSLKMEEEKKQRIVAYDARATAADG